MSGVRFWGKHFFIYNNREHRNDEPHEPRETTHLCLDGGKLNVPFESVPFFHRKLGADIAKGIKNYIVERRTPVFKFHADLDIFEPTVKPYSEILDWIRDGLLNVLRQFYPEFVSTNFEQLTVFVCTTTPKLQVEKYGTVYDKVGVHLLFPGLLVDTDGAMVLRSAFIQYFENANGKREPGYNEWADVFDKTVYVSNGLRMVGCGKMERCKACKGKYNDTGECDDNKCGGKGKYDVGRIYKIQTVLNGDGTENEGLLEELLDDEIFMTEKCSIRCDERVITTENMPKQTFPSWFDPTFEPVTKGVTGGKKCKGKKDSFQSFSAHLPGSRVRLADSDKRVKKIVEWIKNNEIHELFRIPKQYREVQVQDVIMCTPTLIDRYYLVNIDSHYCMNLQDEHKSNGVYFIINEQGLFQKCFCRCPTTESRVSGGTCEQFTSECFQLPDDLAPILFSYSDDRIKSNYVQFVHRCEQSLTSIHDDNKLMSALFDRLLDP